MITIKNKKDCCGCAACYSICPKNCIEMKADEEGFLYPNVNKNICINCGLCEKICPITNKVEEKEVPQEGYLVQIKDERIRAESTSGGAFTAIAKYVLDRKGVVFGVQYDKDLNVVHSYVENEADLKLYRNSKYVQSKIGDTFKQAKKFLDEGRWVCFSGIACQIEGLKNFLRKDYENLITIDLVCRAVPSPLLWKKYVEYQKDKYGNDIKNILFRDKSFYGYNHSQMSIQMSDGKKVYHNGLESDPMLRAMFSNICHRPSCYDDCAFKKRYRVSDFTIWDCFIVEKLTKGLDDKGTTRVLIHSKKGKEIFDEVKNNLNYKSINTDVLTADVLELNHSVKLNNKRDTFMKELQKLKGKELFEKYFKITWKVRIERFIRRTAVSIGVYKLIRQIYRKIFK